MILLNFMMNFSQGILYERNIAKNWYETNIGTTCFLVGVSVRNLQAFQVLQTVFIKVNTNFSGLIESAISSFD